MEEDHTCGHEEASGILERFRQHAAERCPLDDVEAALEESVRDADASAAAWNGPTKIHGLHPLSCSPSLLQ